MSKVPSQEIPIDEKWTDEFYSFMSLTMAITRDEAMKILWDHNDSKGVHTMSKSLSQRILDELLQLEESFREATRIELSKCDTETLLYRTHRGHERWVSGYSVINITWKITRDEATKLLYDQNTETLQGHNDSKGVHTMSKAVPQEILYDMLRLEKSFREVVRRELSECDRETLLIESNRINKKWTDDFYSVVGVTREITRDEATKLYNDSKGVHTIDEILDEMSC